MSGFGEFSSGAAQQITCPALRMRKPLVSKKVRHAVQSFVCHAPITIQPPTARGALLSRPHPVARVPDTVDGFGAERHRRDEVLVSLCDTSTNLALAVTHEFHCVTAASRPLGATFSIVDGN